MKLLENKWLLLGGAAVGVLLLIIPQFFLPSKSAEEPQTEDCTYYSERLEKKISELVAKATGSDSVSVVITLDGGSESLYAANTKSSEGSNAKDYIILNKDGGEGGLAVGQIYPKVRGVAVVCSGGSSVSVQNDVTRLIAAALGISTSRIMVCGQE